MYDSSPPPNAILEKMGQEITRDVKPKAVVVVSAHRETAGPEEGGGVAVNFWEGDGLIYK